MAAREKRITVRELARSLGVSPTTVSFVLNGRDHGISEELSGRILEAACRHRLVRSGRLRRPGRMLLAYVLPDAAGLAGTTTFFQNLYAELHRQAEAHDAEVVLRELDSRLPRRHCFRQAESLLREEYDFYLTCDYGIAAFLRELGGRVILCQSGGAVLEGAINIYCDDYAAGKAAARHLYELGHRRSGMIFFEGTAEHARFRGFRETWAALGGVCAEEHILLIPHDPGLAEAVLAEAFGRLRRGLPKAFYCFADNILFPVLRALHRLGVRVPEEVSLVGTDNLYWGRVACPAFTTVDLHEERFAAAVLEAARGALKEYRPLEIAVPVSLVVRESAVAFRD